MKAFFSARNEANLTTFSELQQLSVIGRRQIKQSFIFWSMSKFGTTTASGSSLVLRLFCFDSLLSQILLFVDRSVSFSGHFIASNTLNDIIIDVQPIYIINVIIFTHSICCNKNGVLLPQKNGKCCPKGAQLG